MNFVTAESQHAQRDGTRHDYTAGRAFPRVRTERTLQGKAVAIDTPTLIRPENAGTDKRDDEKLGLAKRNVARGKSRPKPERLLENWI
jgi:hypothetical protein